MDLTAVEEDFAIVKWMAPELLGSDRQETGSKTNDLLTPQSDVYAYGMTLLEVRLSSCQSTIEDLNVWLGSHRSLPVHGTS